MEILSSGSFINLENQEKIERLQSTAVELANAAVDTEGFTNDEESGKRLALEFWEGLDYMCRESEEAAIRNIFLGHFLDRLRELRPTQTVTSIDLPKDSAADVSGPIDNETKPEDEFLGVIDARSDGETTTQEPHTLSDEISIRTEDNSTPERDFVKAVETETTENVSSEPVPEEPELSVEAVEDKVEREQEKQVETKTAIGNLSLPEKEPYQFNKCTVTATIQLLPAVEEGATSRKVILSVRTHDFAPQISMVELAVNNLMAELMPELENVLARYRSDLPAKVMDKLRREKTAAKKPAPTITSEAKTVSQKASKLKEGGETQNMPHEVNQTGAPAASSPVRTGQQGSLFGF